MTDEQLPGMPEIPDIGGSRLGLYDAALDAVAQALTLTQERLKFLRHARDELIAPEIRDLVAEEKLLQRMLKVTRDKVADVEVE